MIQLSIYKIFPRFFSIQGIEYSSPCYTVGLCWLSILYTTPVLLPGKSHGQRSLVGCSPRGHEELDMTERLHFHFSFSCIGEGNGNPLQCSCLENPRDGVAWWVAIYGVAQSRTRLKWLSSSVYVNPKLLSYPWENSIIWKKLVLKINLQVYIHTHLIHEELKISKISESRDPGEVFGTIGPLLFPFPVWVKPSHWYPYAHP